jgi:SAM-dependent methyltransferase
MKTSANSSATDSPQNRAIYTGFARGYDRVMRDVDFRAWAEYILDLAEDFGIKSKRMLNLACGTGNTEETWLKRGCLVTGFDQSEEMIREAKRKVSPKAKVQFLVDDMRTFDLGETFDLAVCLYDSLNYLTSAEDVQACFARVAAHLPKRGGFIFDVATEANILENFTNITYAENFEDFAYVWENEYNIRSKICRSDFHFFYRDEASGAFHRFSETHFQKMYAVRDLLRWVKEAGFEFVGSFEGFSKNPPTAKSDRIHFVTRKI